MKKICKVLTVMLAAVMLVTCIPMSASAASTSSAYKKVGDNPVKAGKYYYKYDVDSEGFRIESLLRSNNKYSGYKKILNAFDDVFTNGKYIYRVVESKNRFYLARYNSAGKNRKLLKKLPKSGEYSWWTLGTVKGKYVFLTLGNMDKFKYYTYRFNTSSKSFKKVMTNCELYTEVNGSYVLGNYYLDESGVIANRTDLYKISSKGKLTRIKKLGDNAEGAFVGKKLYYVVFYESYDETSEYEWPVTAKVYRCSRSGKNRVLIKTITGQFNGDGLHAENFTADGCDIWMGAYTHHLDYATGEVTTTLTYPDDISDDEDSYDGEDTYDETGEDIEW